jgi:hypothetical protein
MPFSSNGRSETVVTPLPRLPFVSRLTRTTVDLLGADGSLLQVQVVFNWWHLEQRSFRQLFFAIVESLLLFADLRQNPGLFHLFPQMSELSRRFAGGLSSFSSHCPFLLHE